MEKNRVQKLGMFLAVRSVCESVPEIWKPNASFSQSFSEFRSNVGLLRAVIAAAEAEPGEKARRLAGVLFEVATSTLAVAGVLTSYATARNYQALRHNVELERTEFLKRSPEEIVATAQTVLAEAECRRPEMAERGVTDAVLSRLGESILVYEALTKSQSVDEWISQKTERIEALLKCGLDREIEVFKTDQPAFYLAYTEARIGKSAPESEMSSGAARSTS